MLTSMTHKADLLLITVNEHETTSLLAAFEQLNGKARPVQIDQRVYRDLGSVNGTTVFHAISEMGSGGLGAAHQTVNRAISALHPQAVIGVGIAFGVSEQKQRIGDILLSKQLMLYEPQRVGTTHTQFRGDRAHASSWLLSYFQNAALSKVTKAKVHTGLILSGEKLLDNLEYLNELLSAEPSAIGGEMEGAGLYTAAHEEKIDWVVIKAICDWADGNKSKDKENRQELAAANAAEFVVQALQEVPLIVSRNSSTGRIHTPPQETLGTASKRKTLGDFSDADREIFLDECFEQIAASFANTLLDFQSNESAVQTKFKRVDATKFTAVIFQNGRSSARCKIVLGGGGMPLAITYSGNDNPIDNSFNEALSVKADKEGLYLNPTGMQFVNLTGRQRMDKSKAFEYLWELFTTNLD